MMDLSNKEFIMKLGTLDDSQMEQYRVYLNYKSVSLRINQIYQTTSAAI